MATTFDNLELRVNNLENLVNGLINTLNNNKFYTDADIAGCRQGISEITPDTETKTGYIGDTEVVFTDVQGTTGNLSVFFDNDNIGADYTVSRFVNSIVIGFLKPLEEVTQVTISII